MTNVAFRAAADPPGLVVHDLVDNRQFTLYTSDVPAPEPASTEPFVFTVEKACRVTTRELVLNDTVQLILRNQDGSMVTMLNEPEHESFGPGARLLEVSAPVKTYILFDGSFDVHQVADQRQLSFDQPTNVTVAARSYHRRPTATVTTTDALDDIRRAVETLSSALHTLSPERSYPTLRGHPPNIQLGDELVVPDECEPPATGITLTVSRDLRSLFAVAPLAFYLGAAIEFGESPELRADDSTFPLSGDALCHEVERILQHVFLLDCLTRTHGLYEVSTQEYTALAPRTSLDFQELYDLNPNRRLAAYLSVPTEITAPHTPTWPTVAHIEPTADWLAALPYLMDELALVQPNPIDRYKGKEARKVALSRFVAGSTSKRGIAAVTRGKETFVDVPTADATHQQWVGEGIPLNASKFIAAGYENRFRREPDDRQELRVIIVCNDSEMAIEAENAEEWYQPYTDQPFDLDLYEQVTTGGLATLLRHDVEFFHYIGHATDRGLQCPDGHLDVATLDAVGARSFLLNACQSYEEGCSLVECGAVGGLVTLGDVSNDTAVEAGTQVARLLNSGFSLRDARSVLSRQTLLGGQYTVVGDGGEKVLEPAGDIAHLCRAEAREDGYELWIETYTDQTSSLGSTILARVTEDWPTWIVGNESGPHQVEKEELLSFLHLDDIPLWLDGEFHWSTDLTRDDLE